MGDEATLAGVVVSGAALVVSIFALIKSSRAQLEANDAQKRIVEIEENRERDRLAATQRAELRAELRKTAKSTDRLYVINDGTAPARNVVVLLDGKPLSDHPVAVKGDELGAVIGPKSETSCIMGMDMGCAPPFEIEISWEDDSNEPQSYKSTLTH